MSHESRLYSVLSLALLAASCGGERAGATPRTVDLPAATAESSPAPSAPPRSPRREVRWDRDKPPSPEDAARAEALFREARSLLEKSEFAEACERFADSMELAPALGTLLNMASCAERAGNHSQACEWFAAARDMAREKAQSDRERFAESRLKALGCP